MFPEIYAARQKNKLEQIEEIKPSGCMLELALDGHCDSPGCKVMYNTVSATDTATNKLIIFSVVYVKVWNYVYETTHYVCAFCLFHAHYQCHDISLIASKNTETQMGTMTFTLTYICFDRNVCRQKTSRLSSFFSFFANFSVTGI